MTRGEYEQKSLTYWEHYKSACEKHPFFARGIAEITDPYYQERKDSAINIPAIYWSKQAQLGKILRDETLLLKMSCWRNYMKYLPLLLSAI